MSFPVFTVADLASGLRGLTPRPLLAVFGDPVAHSRSPQMHNPALRAREIDGQYIRLHVRAEEFRDALRLCQEAGFAGVNCTIPHKFAALEAADEVDPHAAQLGAVNTIVFRSGIMLGFNSDGPGLQRAITEAFNVPLSGLRIAILGAGGGAGRAAAAQCVSDHCRSLMLLNRTHSKSAALAKELTASFPTNAVTAPVHMDFTEIDLIINATSVGMNENDRELVPAAAWKPEHLVYDMVYSPPQTSLLRAAAAAGARVANGLSMLLHQGAVSFEHWFGAPAPLGAMRRGLERSFSREES